jgi:hypothetical protein
MLRELIQQRPTGNVKPIKVADKDDEMVVFGVGREALPSSARKERFIFSIA